MRSRWFSRSEMPSARVRLPGPRQSSAVAKDPARRAVPRARRRRIRTSPFERLERADEDGRRRPFGLGHGVHQVVHAVVEIHVGDAGRAIERRVAPRRTRRRVAGGIGFADVGFDFDDDAGGDAGARVVHEHVADEIARDVERRSRVEHARENHDEAAWLSAHESS